MRIFAAVAAIVVVLALLVFLNRSAASATPTPRLVSDVVADGTAVATIRTFLCVEPNGTVARDWNFVDRWVKPQLTYDTYVVDGRVYNAFRIVTDDPKLSRGSVRFRKVIVNIGDGPTLEGHSYLNTRINGAKVKMERELLFVEFNGRLERQRRPLPACGTPRS